MSKQRDYIFDFFRGIIIIDMMIVHYGDAVHKTLPGIVTKVIGYSDVAIEGFIFIAGYMIGRNYVENYNNNRNTINRKLIGRTISIIKTQYWLIFTASLPVFLITNSDSNSPAVTGKFILESMLFLNQLGLMHILPTFVPLFLFSIPIVYLVSVNRRWIVVVASVLAFAVGNMYPYLFNLGDKTIFPVILWQIYFVAGILAGHVGLLSQETMQRISYKVMASALIVFLGSSLLVHGHFDIVKSLPFLKGSKFPLDFLGLLYRGSMMVLVYCVIYVLWERIKAAKVLHNFFTLFGRHSLEVFVIHVYFCLLLQVISYFIGVNLAVGFAVFLVNVVFSVAYFQIKQRRKLALNAE